MNTPAKRCSTCEIVKPISEFYKNKSAKDGFQNCCKSCTSLYGKRHYKNNKHVVLETHAKYRETHKNELNQKSREKYIKNREYNSERKRVDRQLRPEIYKARTLRYNTTNREMIRAKARAKYWGNRGNIVRVSNTQYTFNPQRYISVQLRRAKKRGLPAEYTYQDWLDTLKYWGNRCVVCNSEHSIEMDHWIPLNDIDNCPGTVVGNIIPLCASCNRSKGHLDALSWLLKYNPVKAPSIMSEVLYFIVLFPQHWTFRKSF